MNAQTTMLSLFPISSRRVVLAILVASVASSPALAQSGGPFYLTGSVFVAGVSFSRGGPFTIAGTIGHGTSAKSPTGGPFEAAVEFWSDLEFVATPGAPDLQFARVGSEAFTASWKLAGTDFVLEETEDLLKPIWSPRLAPWSILDGTVTVLLERTSDRRFFRLSAGTLGDSIAQRYCGLLPWFTPAATGRLVLGSAAFQKRVTGTSSDDFESFAREEVTSRFENLDPQVADLAVFYVLADPFKGAPAEVPCICSHEAIRRMSELEAEHLQLATERRSALRTTLSNLLARIHGTATSLAANLK